MAWKTRGEIILDRLLDQDHVRYDKTRGEYYGKDSRGRVKIIGDKGDMTAMYHYLERSPTPDHWIKEWFHPFVN